MKIKSFLLSLLLLGIAGIAVSGQSVLITAKQSVYRRPNPKHDFKRTFTIRCPVAKASTAALSKKITTAINPELILDINLREERGEYQWLDEADFKVVYNRNGILSIDLWMTGSAAYPDGVTKHLVVDIQKGKRVLAPDIFLRRSQLARVICGRQIEEVKKTTQEIKKAEPDSEPELLFGDRNFTTADMNELSVNAKGVTFFYDYRFPHVAQGLEPSGEFFFSYAELRPFIRPDGLLARLVR